MGRPDVCAACGKPIVLVNAGLARGVITLAQMWVHRSRWVRHHAIPLRGSR